MHCFHCGKPIQVIDIVRRGDSCPHCEADVRVCKNCTFYDPQVYNECKEHNAERVVDKLRSNYCEFFTPADRALTGAGKTTEQTRAEAAKAAAENLFKKK